ncbi:MAG: RNA binding, partial [Marteilia pararefringens]
HAPSYQQHANENYDSYPNDRSRPSNSWSPNFQPGYAQPYHHSPSAPNQQASGYRAARDAYSDRGYDAGHDNRYYNAPDRAYPAGAPSSSYNNNNANYGASSGRYYNSSNNNANYGNSNAAYLNHPDSMPRRSDRESKSSEYVCKVRGLPFSATPSDIYDFFSGLSVENVHMCPSLKFPGENDGHAFVFMNTAHDLAMAKKRHRNLMGRRYIEVMSSSMDDFLEFQEFMATSSYQSKAPFKSPELDNPSRYSGGKYQSPNYRDPNYPSQQPQQPPVQRTTYYSNPPESKSNFHQNANTVYGQQQSPRISNPNYGNSFPSDRNLNSSGEYPNASFQSNRSVSNFIRTYK